MNNKNRMCKYKKCTYYDPKAKTYCCAACSADAYDYNRLKKEQIVKHHNENGVWYRADDVTAAIKEAVEDETKDDIIDNLNEIFKLGLFED